MGELHAELGLGAGMTCVVAGCEAWAAAHGRTEQPECAEQSSGAAPRVGRAAPLVDASDDLSKYDQPAASSVGGRKVQGFDGRFEGGGGLHVLVGICVFLDLAGQNTG